MNDSFAVALSKCIEAMRDGELGQQQCLEQYPKFKTNLSSLLNIVGALMYLPYVSPGETYRKESRARILTRVSSVKLSPRSKQPVFGFSFHKAPAIAVMLVLLAAISFGGRQVAFAASSSLPGDSIYQLKTTLEETQFYFADDVEDVILHLDFAQTRLEEVDRLADLKRFENISVAVMGFERHTEMAYVGLEMVSKADPVKGSEIATIVESQTAENIGVLNNLAVSLPADSMSSVQQALTVALELSGAGETPVETLSIQSTPTTVANISDPSSSEGSDEPASVPTLTPVASPTGTLDDSPGNSGNAGNSENAPGAGNENDNGNSGGNAGGNGDENGNAGGNGNGGNNEGNGNGNNGGGNGNGNEGGNGEENSNGNNGEGNGDGGGDGNGNGNNGGGNGNGNGNGGDGEEEDGNGNGNNGGGNGNDK